MGRRHQPFDHCRACGSTSAPRPKRNELVGDWCERTGWKYLDDRSDRLVCPTCKVKAWACELVRLKTSTREELEQKMIDAAKRIAT